MLPDMTIPDDTETYRDATLGTTLNKYQRQSLWTLCEEFSDILTSQPGRTSINLANVEGDVFMPNGITVNSYCPNGVINADFARDCSWSSQSKCDLAFEEVHCLGHIVGNGIVKPDPKKVQAMVDFPLPINKKGLRSFR
jgi:hypothetical protein